MKYTVLTLLFGMMLSFQVRAQMVTDRPDQTESSTTVGKGNLQLESGFLLETFEEEQISLRRILLPTNLFRYGLTETIEIRFLNQFEIREMVDQTANGISDAEIGVKIQILKGESKNTEIAFLSHLLVPSGTKELTIDRYGTINKLSISHVFNESLGLGYNVGYSYFGIEKGILTYSLSLGIGINRKAGIYIEPYGDFLNFERFLLNFDTGFTYLIREHLQIDFSFGTGVNNRMNFLSLGFSWLIEKDQ